MNKQVIEIEVPDGKKAIWDGNKVTFVPEKNWRDITTFNDAYTYVDANLPDCADLIRSYRSCIKDSYEEKVVKLRIIIAALTCNEKRHFATGEVWYPAIQLYRPENRKNCYGGVVVGTVESEGKEYVVMGGYVDNGSYKGLEKLGVAVTNAITGFRSVSSHEVAEHISKYFGRLLFEIHYGGINCDWKWVD